MLAGGGTGVLFSGGSSESGTSPGFGNAAETAQFVSVCTVAAGTRPNEEKWE
jgi:hypothetical protein